MKKSTLPFVIALLFCSFSFAYPIQPRPLRKMIMESEFIVHGRVWKLGSLKTKQEESPWNRDYAIVIIEEVLQGKISTDTIQVFYTAGMACPAPPVYIKDRDAIIFLDKYSKKEKTFQTHALSYGVKNCFDREGIAVYKERILEMQQILKMNDAIQKQDAITEWLVKCACNKYTCWEGVYELSPESDFMLFYDNENNLPKEISLKANQRQTLMDALMITDTLRYAQIGLVDIVRGLDDEKLLNFLKIQLPRLGKNHFWQTEYVMQRIVQMTRDSELERLYKIFNEISAFDEKLEDQRRALFVQFLEKMKDVGLKQAVYSVGDSDA